MGPSSRLAAGGRQTASPLPLRQNCPRILGLIPIVNVIKWKVIPLLGSISAVHNYGPYNRNAMYVLFLSTFLKIGHLFVLENLKSNSMDNAAFPSSGSGLVINSCYFAVLGPGACCKKKIRFETDQRIVRFERIVRFT